MPQWFSLDSWLKDLPENSFPLWGIRSAVLGGDRRCKLNVPTKEVENLWTSWFPSGGGNISPMIDQYAVLRAEVMENDLCHPVGLSVFYVVGSPLMTGAWREAFKLYGKMIFGLQAKHLLEKYLWPSDLSDLYALLEMYPRHVVELSACDRAIGEIPNRNTIVWELRRY